MMEFYQIIIIVTIILSLLYTGYVIGKIISNRKWENNLPDIRNNAIIHSRAVLAGQFSEQLAPYLPDFPFKATECRFIGKPIDLIVFKGMDEKNIHEVEFVEIKSGKSKINKHEKNLRDTIKKGNVRWSEYRIPEELTKKKDKFK